MDSTKPVLTSVEMARRAALETADAGPGAVGDFLRRENLGGGVYDYRFDSGLKGYEHWEWAVTLFHDTGLGQWTVNQAALLPTKRSLVAPPWVPFKDRIPGQSDVDVEKDLEPGVGQSEGGQQRRDRDGNLLDPKDSPEDVDEAVRAFHLSRRLVPSPRGLEDTAQRWQDRSVEPRQKPRGVTDAFVVPLAGFLGRMFGVCTNKHCRFDGRVVPLDHTCAQPDESDDDLYKDLWPDNNPLVDSEHIDVYDDRGRMVGDERTPAGGDEGARRHAPSDDEREKAQGYEEDPTLVSDPRHHDVIENIDDMSLPDEPEARREGKSEDESLLGGGASDPSRARAVEEGFTRVRRRRRR